MGFCPNPRFKDGANINDYIHGWRYLTCALINETVRDEPCSENTSLYNRFRPPVWTVGNTKQQCATNVSSVFVNLTTEEIQNALAYTKPDDVIAMCPAMDINNISYGPFGQNILFDFC